MNQNDKVDFGFERILKSDKTAKVQDIFKRVASRYDLMNDLMSGGRHRLWKKIFVQQVLKKPNQSYLDMAGGTGDIATRLYKQVTRENLGGTITVMDLNASMLREGKDRAIDKGILDGLVWMEGNAESIPLPDSSQDVYMISFGLRNVTDKEKALAEAWRVLKPGGQFLCMEFSPDADSKIKPLYDFYSFQIIPFFGKVVARDLDAYVYLAESIRTFLSPEALAAVMRAQGFEAVTYTPLDLGIVQIHKGFKAQ